jgi:hypothetical protein
MLKAIAPCAVGISQLELVIIADLVANFEPLELLIAQKLHQFPKSLLILIKS